MVEWTEWKADWRTRSYTQEMTAFLFFSPTWQDKAKEIFFQRQFER